MFAERDGERRTWEAFKKVTDEYPLFPFTGYEHFWLPVHLKNSVNMAYRQPDMLVEVWWTALYHAGRVPDPTPLRSTVLMVSDGLADKSSLYHFGIRFVEDSETLSRYSQRDIAVGKLSEKNQFHMLLVGGMCRVTYEYCVSRGYDAIWLSDMESLRAMAAGLCLNPGGQCYALPNSSMARIPWHCSATVHVRYGQKTRDSHVPIHVFRALAEKKFCLWHRDCDKDLWTYENYLRQLFDHCWVDPLDRFHGDVCGVPPFSKMLDYLHACKNALNGWTKSVWTKYPEKRAQVREWLAKHHPGT